MGGEGGGEHIDAIICGLGLPWQRGIWIGRRQKSGVLEIETAQAPSGKQKTKTRGKGGLSRGRRASGAASAAPRASGEGDPDARRGR